MAQSIREPQIQKQILQYLSAKGIFAIRVNSGATQITNKKDGKTRYVRFNSAIGCSDIIAIWPKSGRFLAIEVKRPGGRLTPEQKQFQERVEASKGMAIVCYSVDDLISFLDSMERLL